MPNQPVIPSPSVLRRRPTKRNPSSHYHYGSVNSKEDVKKQKQQNPFYDKAFTGNQLRWTRCDWYLAAVLTILAFATRFFRLGVPAAVVFDELHFLKFVNGILKRQYIFDIHPPLGKQVLAYIGYILGYRATSFIPDKIGKLYPSDVKYYRLRSISALFGTATVPMTYLISKTLGLSNAASAFAATTMLFESLNLTEARYILIDSQLIFWCQVSLYCALRLWKTSPKTKDRLKWLSFTGLAAGVALSIKHTALGTPALIAVVSFFGLHFLSTPLTLLECAYAGLLGISVYVIPFYIHFKTLIYAGGKADKFMLKPFQKTLIGHENYDPDTPREWFPKLFVYLNRRMIASNASIKKRHSWESDWYQWIVNWRGVLYFTQKDKVEEGSNKTLQKSIIYLLGNPVVVYVCLGATLLFVVAVVMMFRYRKELRDRQKGLEREKRSEKFVGVGLFLLAGWMCNLLPYLLVKRAAFIYHYMPGLFYAQLLTALIVDGLPRKPKVGIVVVLGVAMAAAFVYWSPWIYAVSLPVGEHLKRQWLPRWN